MVEAREWKVEWSVMVGCMEHPYHHDIPASSTRRFMAALAINGSPRTRTVVVRARPYRIGKSSIVPPAV